MGARSKSVFDRDVGTFSRVLQHIMDADQRAKLWHRWKHHPDYHCVNHGSCTVPPIPHRERDWHSVGAPS